MDRCAFAWSFRGSSWGLVGDRLTSTVKFVGLETVPWTRLFTPTFHELQVSISLGGKIYTAEVSPSLGTLLWDDGEVWTKRQPKA